jgi:hypothetical protein
LPADIPLRNEELHAIADPNKLIFLINNLREVSIFY